VCAIAAAARGTFDRQETHDKPLLRSTASTMTVDFRVMGRFFAARASNDARRQLCPQVELLSRSLAARDYYEEFELAEQMPLS
jgi:hypothetical protein